MAKSRSTPSRRSRYCRWRMRAGIVLVPLLFLWARPTPSTLLVALCVALPGLALRLWASGHIEKARCLATGGPYAHTRHPLYLGNLCLALAFALACANPWTLLLVAAYCAGFYPRIMREEDSFLRGTFPGEYDRWAGTVPALIPRLQPAGPRAGAFHWRRVLVNGEWRAWLCWVSVFALLAVLSRDRFAAPGP